MKNSKYGTSFVIFGVVCLITAWIFSSQTGDSLKQSFPPAGGKFGPVTIDKKNEVVEIKITQRVANGHWSAIEAEVVDAKDQYLFAFSEELWFETGRDSEGPWQEGKRNYDISVTFPKPGNYFINFSSENSRSSSVDEIRVEASKKLGSSLAHLWLGFISLIIGVATLFFSGDSSGWIKSLEKTGL